MRERTNRRAREVRKIVHEVAVEEALRLLREAVEPLEARALNPARRALQHAGRHLEGTADADRDGHAEGVLVGGDPLLLLRRAERDEQNVRRRLEKDIADARAYAATGFARDMLIETQRRDPARRNPNNEGGRREMP